MIFANHFETAPNSWYATEKPSATEWYRASLLPFVLEQFCSASYLLPGQSVLKWLTFVTQQFCCFGAASRAQCRSRGHYASFFLFASWPL